jgi:hypothetical protein
MDELKEFEKILKKRNIELKSNFDQNRDKMYFTFTNLQTGEVSSWTVNYIYKIREMFHTESTFNQNDFTFIAKTLFHYLRKSMKASADVLVIHVKDEEDNLYLPFEKGNFDIELLTDLEEKVIYRSNYGYMVCDGYRFYLTKKPTSTYRLVEFTQKVANVYKKLKEEDVTFHTEKEIGEDRCVAIYWKGVRYVSTIDDHYPGFKYSLYKTNYSIICKTIKEVESFEENLYQMFQKIYIDNRLNTVFEKKMYHYELILKKMSISTEMEEVWKKELLKTKKVDEIEEMIAKSEHRFFHMERVVFIYKGDDYIWILLPYARECYSFEREDDAYIFAKEEFVKIQNTRFEKEYLKYKKDQFN